MVYTAKYVRIKGLRDLLYVDRVGSNEKIKLRVSEDAKEIFVKYFDKSIEMEIKFLIDRLPHKNKELKRFYVDINDIDNLVGKKLDPIQETTLIRSIAIRKELLTYGEKRIRVPKEVIPYFDAYLEYMVKQNMIILKERLPRSKKNNEIKRVTFQVEDIY